MRSPRDLIGRDPGLQARMLITLSLLALLYVVLGGVIIAAGGGLVVMVVLLAAMALGQLWLSERLALRAMHARVVSAQDAPGLHALVERLAIQADVPMPRVAISEIPVPNAFAMGRSPKHATVCVTTGLLQILERNELEGVLAHEIGHIRNRDVALMTMASFFASLAALVGQVAAFGGLGRDRDSGPGLAVILLVSIAVYFISYFLMLALSRYREFAADRSAALFTGRPSALASALRRLESASSQAPQQDLREVASMQAFFIVPARGASAMSRLFATHPPTEERIARLAQMESRLQAA
ncbi:MAG TPA: zinc metalloprotease HtpX [Thermoleophilaceae bacterium]|nr:zinc metalloprotease HtpX [Thermoleophilaceae bacterium]